MKFERGNKVEVLSTSDTPFGSWWSAEIISGNGHFYSVKYDDHLQPDESSALVERVSRKVIRHRPPVLKHSMNWAPRDMVEVFDCGSWKTAQISRTFNGNHFYVILLGFFREFRIHHSKMRPQQFWDGDKWVVVKKNFSNYQLEVVNDAANLEPISQTPDLGKTNVDLSKRGVKRKLGPPKLNDSPERISSMRDQKTSTENRAGHCDTEKWIQFKANFNLFDDDTISKKRPETDSSSLSSSSESSDTSSSSKSSRGRKYDISTQADTDSEIHKTELDAYRAAMKALYVSGRMSRERQIILQNLRVFFHISKEEHILTLKYVGV